MLSVNTSYALMVGQRSLMNAHAIINQAAERLMTGKRINRASDDPAGMVAVNEFQARAAVLNKEIENLDNRAALLGAKEGAYSVINDLLIELEGTVVEAANTGGLTEDERESLQMRTDSILEALDMVYTTSRFRGESLFTGLFTTGAGSVWVEGDQDDSTDDDPRGTQYHLANLKSGGALNLIDGDLEAAQDSIEAALSGINSTRAGIGSVLTHEIESLKQVKLVELENLMQAQSLIEDADYAKETAELVRGQILQQASIYAILFARQQPAAALQLLQSSANLITGN
ncbi:MAG: hypothetical protein IT431_09815 [Phycisphaerales bacterium]|nr:hypothetical protein [Phycisphaerales bacterium]